MMTEDGEQLDIFFEVGSLGTQPGSLIYAIRSALFDQTTGEILETVEYPIDIYSSAKLGFTIDPYSLLDVAEQKSTNAFEKAQLLRNRPVWQKENPEVKIWNLKDAFADWCRWPNLPTDIYCQYWCAEPSFEVPLLLTAAERVNEQVPWGAINSSFTVYWALGWDYRPTEIEECVKNPFAEVENEARWLSAALQKIATLKSDD